MKKSMREFFEPFREELLQQGIERGIEQGLEQGKVQGAILTMLDLDIPEEVIIKKVSDKFGLTKEQVRVEFSKLFPRQA